MILPELWRRAQAQYGLAQDALTAYFDEAELPLSPAVINRMLRGKRKPQENPEQIVAILLHFFGERRLLFAEEEVEALGRWFGLLPGTALDLMVCRVEHTNLDVPLNPEVFQKPESIYHSVLNHLALAHAPYVTLEGPPGSGKTTLAQHLGLNPLLSSWYDVVLYAPAHHQAGWRAGDEAAILETLNEFRWTLDPGQSPAENPTAAHSDLRRLLRGRRALFILDDVADVRVLPRLFVRGATHGLLAVVASGTALDDADLHLHRVDLPEWSHQQACRYVAAVLRRELSGAETGVVETLNAWGRGLPLLWAVLAELLAFEDDWPALVEEFQAASLKEPRIDTVLTRLLVRLPPAETHLLETWGVFAPGSSLDPPAMAYVADIELDKTRQGLRSLRRRHLLRSGRGRFELHPLLGRLARQRLADSSRLAICAERHARFYAERTRPIRQEQDNSRWPTIVREILPDLPNVRLGQAWAAERGHPLAVDYFLNLSPYLVAIRDLERDRAWGQTALPVVEANPAALPALDRLTFYAQVSAADLEQQRAYLDRALAIIRDEMRDEPLAYRFYGLCWLAHFLYDQARAALEAEKVLIEALDLAAESGYPDLETHALGETAAFFLFLRDRAGLEALAGRLPVEPPAMHSAGLQGNHYHILRAETLRWVGHWREAEGIYTQILELYDAIQDRRHGAVFRLRRALCREHLDDVENVQADLTWVQERLAELPWVVQVRHQLTLGELALKRQDAEGARDALQAMPEGWEEDADLALDAWLLWRQVHQAHNRAAKAREAEDQARAITRARGFDLQLEEARRTLSPVEGSLAPTLLAKIVGGRPPLC